MILEVFPTIFCGSVNWRAVSTLEFYSCNNICSDFFFFGSMHGSVERFKVSVCFWFVMIIGRGSIPHSFELSELFNNFAW